MGLPLRDTQHHAYAEYLAWPEDARYELIDGIAYLMSPAPPRSHRELAGELYLQVRLALEGKTCRAYYAPFDVRLSKAEQSDEETDTVVQPDVLIVCDRSKLDRRGMRGAPDWVAEILSPSTAGHDQITKLAAYERAGVPEVWLLHPILSAQARSLQPVPLPEHDVTAERGASARSIQSTPTAAIFEV
jgi:Uma2 family endonuclease